MRIARHWCGRLPAEAGAGGDTWCAVDVRERRLRVAGDLALAGIATQLDDGLVDLAHPDAPIGSPLARHPPSVFTGKAPPISVAPLRTRTS